MKIKIVATVDKGKERENNEDAYIVCPNLTQQDWSYSGTPTYIQLNKYGSLMVVADGMGEANAGEVASAIAVKSIRCSFTTNKIENALNSGNIDELLFSCIKDADEAINNKIRDNLDTIGMGTTIVICWIIEDIAHIAWCGDSRCYVYNPFKGLEQITKDHSLVQELIDKGKITKKEAFTHPDNNVLTRCIGDVGSSSLPELITYPTRPNDIILLCSDGLSGYCANRDMERVLDNNYMNMMNCRDELLKLSLKIGGYDNICIALASMIDNNQDAPSVPTLIQKCFIKLKRVFKTS